MLKITRKDLWDVMPTANERPRLHVRWEKKIGFDNHIGKAHLELKIKLLTGKLTVQVATYQGNHWEIEKRIKGDRKKIRGWIKDYEYERLINY